MTLFLGTASPSLIFLSLLTFGLGEVESLKELDKMAHKSVFILIIISPRCFPSEAPHLSCDKHSNRKVTLLNHKCVPQITTKLALGGRYTEARPAAFIP